MSVLFTTGRKPDLDLLGQRLSANDTAAIFSQPSRLFDHRDLVSATKTRSSMAYYEGTTAQVPLEHPEAAQCSHAPTGLRALPSDTECACVDASPNLTSKAYMVHTYAGRHLLCTLRGLRSSQRLVAQRAQSCTRTSRAGVSTKAVSGGGALSRVCASSLGQSAVRRTALRPFSRSCLGQVSRSPAS